MGRFILVITETGEKQAHHFDDNFNMNLKQNRLDDFLIRISPVSFKKNSLDPLMHQSQLEAEKLGRSHPFN